MNTNAPSGELSPPSTPPETDEKEEEEEEESEGCSVTSSKPHSRRNSNVVVDGVDNVEEMKNFLPNFDPPPLIEMVDGERMPVTSPRGIYRWEGTTRTFEQFEAIQAQGIDQGEEEQPHSSHWRSHDANHGSDALDQREPLSEEEFPPLTRPGNPVSKTLSAPLDEEPISSTNTAVPSPVPPSPTEGASPQTTNETSSNSSDSNHASSPHSQSNESIHLSGSPDDTAHPVAIPETVIDCSDEAAFPPLKPSSSNAVPVAPSPPPARSRTQTPTVSPSPISARSHTPTVSSSPVSARPSPVQKRSPLAPSTVPSTPTSKSPPPRSAPTPVPVPVSSNSLSRMLPATVPPPIVPPLPSTPPTVPPPVVPPPARAPSPQFDNDEDFPVIDPMRPTPAASEPKGWWGKK